MNPSIEPSPIQPVPISASNSPSPQPTPKPSALLPILITFLLTSVLLIGGYFGYQYLNTSKQITSDPNCITEGGTIPVIPNPPNCCPGTTLINPQDPNLVGSHGFCTSKCGNNACDSETESSYNCPSDCIDMPTNTVPSDWKTYSNNRYGYQLEYPNSFTITEEDGSIDSQLVPNQKVQRTTLSDKSTTITIYYEGEFNHGFEPWELDKRENFTINDKPTIKTTLTSLESDNLWIIYTIENLQDFRIEVTTDAESTNLVDQILSTIKFNQN